MLTTYDWPVGLSPCASLDSNIALFFRHHLSHGFADVLLGLTLPGSAPCVASLIIALILLLSWKKAWHRLITLLLTVPGGAALGEGLKLLVQRPRPFLSGPFGEWGGYSFPSGHTIAATLLYGFLALSLLSIVQRRRYKFATLAAAALLVFSVGFSRIALGAHYFSDVLAAISIGTLWTLLCSSLVNAFRPQPAPLTATPRHAPTPPQPLRSINCSLPLQGHR